MIIIQNADSQYLHLAGGKGSSLLRLQDLYKNIPKFFVLCPDSEEDIDSAAASVLDAFDTLGVTRVAVRSSASVEDQHRTSFAGQFETRLNVTRDSLLPAIHFVYASRRALRVQSYSEAHQVDHSSIQMSIVVQCLIPGDVSGVSFSRYVHNERLGIVEACWGLGESIVSGKETPDRYIFERKNTNRIVETTIGNQLYMVSPESEIDYEKVNREWNSHHNTQSLVPTHKRLRKKLLDKEISQVANLALHIEKQENYSCSDIEFCFHDGKLYLLQARPGPEANVRGELVA
jgi:pyruvate, water dikinase